MDRDVAVDLVEPEIIDDVHVDVCVRHWLRMSLWAVVHVGVCFFFEQGNIVCGHCVVYQCRDYGPFNMYWKKLRCSSQSMLHYVFAQLLLLYLLRDVS